LAMHDSRTTSSVSVVARGDLWRAEASNSSNSAAASASAPTGVDAGAGYGARSGDASRSTHEWLARSGGPAKWHGRRVGCSHGPASSCGAVGDVRHGRPSELSGPPLDLAGIPPKPPTAPRRP
jgi:hypothetical protein